MNVYEKIAEVMKDVSYLQKDDAIAFANTRYKAISEEKVTSAVRESLIKHGLVILPVKQEHKREGTLSTVDTVYRIQNIEKLDDFIEVSSSGTGVDTQDKGVGKAMTYSYKYMLLRSFAIPTGEDPDKISSAELDNKQSKSKKQDVGSQDAPTPTVYTCENCQTRVTKRVRDRSVEVNNGKVFCSPECVKENKGIA